MLDTHVNYTAKKNARILDENKKSQQWRPQQQQQSKTTAVKQYENMTTMFGCDNITTPI